MVQVKVSGQVVRSKHIHASKILVTSEPALRLLLQVCMLAGLLFCAITSRKVERIRIMRSAHCMFQLNAAVVILQ